MQINYATEEAYKVYIDYLAIKKHFTTKGYDYFKYAGKVSASYNTFQTRKDVYYFYKLSKMPNWHEIILSNMISNPKTWIRDLCEETARDIYLNWKKRIDGLVYTVSSDLAKLDMQYSKNFELAKSNHPHIVTLYMQKKISLETFVVLCKVSNVLETWEVQLKDTFIAKDIILMARKYEPFLEIDIKKFSKIIKDKFF